MIRAGRRHLVRTLADLAEQQGVRLQSYFNAKPHTAEGFPDPISSARVLLYDGEQVDAYLMGRPVPPLPERDDGQDLLDRRECAALLDVAPRSWDKYKQHPALAQHRTEVGGVEHWPRAAVARFKEDRPDRTTAPGRPKWTGDQVPQEQLLARTAPLLDADPGITSTGVVEALGVHRDTAQDALTRLRADRMAALMDGDDTLTPQRAAQQLGYPAAQVRRATVRAQAVLRGHRMRPYLADVAQALHHQGWTSTATPPDVQHPDDDTVTAVLLLDGAQPPAPALVWDDRYGWRTAASRRHPLPRGAGAPPPGDGVRYLAADTTTPPPTALLAALKAS
ncbi:DUF6292 family protein [Streptomyces sp. NBC_00342]|uniref:DUF6292 family protein n=1 Tax=Streptomyces sp. NBC_00342 TaxID=2975718 RepID=UPI002E2D29EF|nr:DUF6292 family protein [Streptomyces sp. NBC_00342]